MQANGATMAHAKPVRAKDAALVRRQSRAAGGSGAPKGKFAQRGALSVAFLDEDGRVAFDRVTDRLGLTRGQLAETLGLSPETLRRWSRANAPRTQARAAEALEIITRIA